MIKQNKSMDKLESQVEQLLKERNQQESITIPSSQASTIEEDSSEKLVQSLSSLSLKNQELDDLKKALITAQQDALKKDNFLIVQLQENSTLKKQIEWHNNQANSAQCLF